MHTIDFAVNYRVLWICSKFPKGNCTHLANVQFPCAHKGTMFWIGLKTRQWEPDLFSFLHHSLRKQSKVELFLQKRKPKLSFFSKCVHLHKSVKVRLSESHTHARTEARLLCRSTKNKTDWWQKEKMRQNRFCWQQWHNGVLHPHYFLKVLNCEHNTCKHLSSRKQHAITRSSVTQFMPNGQN